MKSSNTSIQIRFADIDWMGHVNNASYITYLETARLHFFNLAGARIDWRKTGFILARTEINYLRPVYLTDQLNVKTWCNRIGTKSFELSYSVTIKQNEIVTEVANAVTVLVCYDYEHQTSVVMPDEWRKHFE